MTEPEDEPNWIKAPLRLAILIHELEPEAKVKMAESPAPEHEKSGHG